MEFKEQIVRSLALELRNALPPTGHNDYILTVRCDHGCWELVLRDPQFKKHLECSLTDHRHDNDAVYITAYDDMALTRLELQSGSGQRIDSLSDPGFFERLVRDFQFFTAGLAIED